MTLWLNGPLGVVAGGVPAVQPPWWMLSGVSCLLCFLEATALAMGGRRGTVLAAELRLVAAEELV